MRKTLSAVAARKMDKVALSWPRLRSLFNPSFLFTTLKANSPPSLTFNGRSEEAAEKPT
jgi:hypothetical protein